MASSEEWNITCEKLKTVTEMEAFKMLREEQNGQRRFSYLQRIYGRYNVLRYERERKELFDDKSA